MGTLESPATLVRQRLQSFSRGENVLFRVKVVDAADGSGRIIAMANRIRPTGPQEAAQASLLPVSVEDLDGEVYRVDFPDDAPPTLLLNRALDTASPLGIKALAKTPLFVSMVFPSVVRQILTRILVVDEARDDDDDESPAAKWRRFAKRHNPAPVPDDEDQLLDWIDAAVAAIAKDLHVVQRFRQGVEAL